MLSTSESMDLATLSRACLRAALLAAALLLASSWAAHADFRAAEQASKSKDWPAVLRACKADAEAGEKNCQMWMAQLYKYGRGVERNLPASVDILKKCAAQGQMYCEEMLGDSYRSGLGVPVDYVEALRLFKLSASKGNPYAFNNLGNMYRFGQGVQRDAAEAAKNYRTAADKGNVLAMANLADLYRLGDGVEKNGELALQWARKASEQNDGGGWNIVGLLNRDGMGVRRDPAAAIAAFKRAVEPNVNNPAPVAYANLAMMYYVGMGIPVDLDEAARWAEAGVRVNQRDCMVWLANILARGGKTVPEDKARAFQLAKRAHEMGLPAAADTLGYFHRDGIGTPVNYAQAIRLYNEAINGGNINAAVGLGRMYLDGLGVAKDPAKANEYFQLGRARMDSLGPGNRRFIETYFTNQALDANRQVAPASKSPAAEAKPPAPAPGPSPAPAPAPAPASAPAPVTASKGPDPTQQALLDRIEKMQKQLELLQSATSANDQNQEIQPTSQTAVRRALVIGNDKYRNVLPLLNAGEDASAIASTLTQLGYTVSLHRDVDEKKFKQAIRDFRGTLEGGEEVLFFFAGHGVQLGAANYLLPVDVQADNEDQVKDEAIELQRVLDDLKSRSTKFALAIIDACRDNPFKQSGRAIGGRGLAPTTAATGQMIMFSAGAGQQALDKLSGADKDKNGVFTRVLLNEMRKPGVPVDRVLRNVRNEVVRLSKGVGHEQTPALYDQAVGDFYFSLK